MSGTRHMSALRPSSRRAARKSGSRMCEECWEGVRRDTGGLPSRQDYRRSVLEVR